MGQNVSLMGHLKDPVLNDWVDEAYFSPQNLASFYEMYYRKFRIPGSPDALIDPTIFSIVIERLLMDQSVFGKCDMNNALQMHLFEIIDHQIDPLLRRATPFSDRLKYISDIISGKIENEIHSMTTNLKEIAKSMIYEPEPISHGPVVISSAFEVFLDIFDGVLELDVEVFENLLDKLNETVFSNEYSSNFGVDPSLLARFTSFLVDLTMSPKFSTDTIKTRVIQFLLRIAPDHGGILTVLRALSIGVTSLGISLPHDYPVFCLDPECTDTSSECQGGYLYGMKTLIENVDGDIYAAAASGSNLFLLTVDGLIEVTSQGRKLRTIPIENPLTKLVTCDETEIYLYDRTTRSVSLFHINEGFISTVDLSAFIRPEVPVVAVVKLIGCPLLFFVLEAGFYEYEIVGFDLSGQSLRKSLFETVQMSFAAKFILPSDSSMYFTAPDRDVSLRVRVCQNEPSGFWGIESTRYVPPPMVYGDNGIAISSRVCSYFLVRDVECTAIYHYPHDYGVEPLVPKYMRTVEAGDIHTVGDLVTKTVSDANGLLFEFDRKFRRGVTNKSKSLEFFLGMPSETIRDAIHLGTFCLENENMPDEMRQRILFFILMVLRCVGRFHVARYASDVFSFTSDELNLHGEIRQFLERTAVHPLSTIEMISAVFSVISVMFSLIYYPCFGNFRKFLDGFSDDPETLALCWPFLGCSPAMFFGLDKTILKAMKPYLPHQIMFHNIYTIIFSINLQVCFLEKNNMKSDELYLGNFLEAVMYYCTESICFSEVFSRDQDAVVLILRLFSRILVIDSAPHISLSFAASQLQLLHALQKNYAPSNMNRRNDIELFSAPEPGSNLRRRDTVVETEHPYPNGKGIVWKIEMPGATEICVEFDERCATEINTDYLQIYNRKEGGAQIGPNYSGPVGHPSWPKKLVIHSDSCRFQFSSDDTGNDWGIRCTVWAFIPLTVRSFYPDLAISAFNLVSYALGRSLQHALLGEPVSELERTNKIILESGLLCGVYAVFQTQEMKQAQKRILSLVNTLEQTSEGSNKILRMRSQSEKEDVIPVDVFSLSEGLRSQSILDDLTANVVPSNSLASLLLNSLYEVRHARIVRMAPLSFFVERFVCAAIIKTLGLVSLSLSFGKELLQCTANPSGKAKPPLPLALENLAKAMYRIRASLHFSYQKSKAPTKNEKVLRENYEQFVTEILLKAQLLLLNETTESVTEAMRDEGDMERHIEMLVSFMCSDLRCSDLEEMLRRRVDRANMRIKAMDVALDFLNCEDLFHTAKGTFLSPIMKSLPSVMDKASIRSVSLDLMQAYDAQIVKVRHRLTELMVSANLPVSLQTLILRVLLLFTSNSANDDETIISLVSFLALYTVDTLEAMGFYESLWLFVMNLIMQNKTEKVCSFLQEMLTRQDIAESVVFKIVSSQSYLVLNKLYPNLDVQFYLNLLERCNTPRIFVAVFQLLGIFFAIHGVPQHFQVFFDNEDLDFAKFASKLMKFIGIVKAHGKIPMLNKNACQSSHLMIADELVSFFRVLLAPTSHACQRVRWVIEDVIGEVAISHNLKGLSTQTDVTISLVALLAIFGSGIETVFEGGHVLVTAGRDKGDILKVSTYSPVSDVIYGYSLARTNRVSVKLNSCVPCSRFSIDPCGISFSEILVNFFMQFHIDCMEVLSENRVWHNHVLLFTLINSFYAFLPLVIQHPMMRKKVLDNLEKWIDFSVWPTKETRLHSLSEFSTEINDVMGVLSDDESSRKLKSFDTKSTRKPENEQKAFLPDAMTVLNGNGEVKGHVGKTPSSATFVGNMNLISPVNFYWEIRVFFDCSNPKISIGFMRSENSPERIRLVYGLELGSGEMFSGALPSVNLGGEHMFRSGDVFGIAILDREIRFFRNGSELLKRIMAPHVGTLSPFIAFEATHGSFEVNFGHAPFVTHSSMQIQNCSNEKIDSLSIRPSPQREFLSDNIWPGWACTMKTTAPTPKEGKVADISVPDNLKRRFGRIGVVREVTLDKEMPTAFVDFCSCSLGIIETVQFPTALLSALPLRKLTKTEFGHEQLIDHDYLCEMTGVGLDLTLTRAITQLFCLTRALSIRMSRYVALLVMDHMRIDSGNEKFVSLLSTLILELTSFTPAVVIKQEWTNNLAKETLFHGLVSKSIFVIEPTRLLKKLRGVLYEIYKRENESELFLRVFQRALKILLSDVDSAARVFKEAPEHLKFMSNLHCSELHVNYHVSERNSVGFIPVLDQNCNLSSSTILVSNVPFTGKCDDIQFIEGSELEIVGSIKNLDGVLRVAFVPLERVLSDRDLDTAKGAVHLVFSLLSLIFSYQASTPSPVLFDKVKHDLLPAFVKVLKGGGPFGTTFGIEFTAPLLARLNWGPGDLRFSTLSLIEEYLKQFEHSIKDWTKLSIACQQATLISVLKDLILTDFAKSDVKNDKNGMTISSNAIEKASDANKIAFFYETLHEKVNTKPTCAFQEISDSFTRVFAMAHDWTLPIRFPSFLLFESFFSSVHHEPIIIDSYFDFTFSESQAIRDICIPHATKLSISCESIPDLEIIEPNDSRHVIHISSGFRTSINGNFCQIKMPKDLDKFAIKIELLELSDLGRKHVFMSQIDKFFAFREAMEKKWDYKIDETLLKIMYQNQDVTSKPLKLSHKQLAAYPILQTVSPDLLSVRFELIKQLTRSVKSLLACVDLNDKQTLPSAVIAAKSAIDTSYKLEIFRKRVMTDLNEMQKLNLIFSRSRAALHMTNPSHPDAKPLILQLIEQVPLSSLHSLKRDSVPWHVNLLGEGALDAGGPARDIFSELCLEVMHPVTGLFVMTPNKKQGNGPNQESLIPNSHAITPKHEQMFFYTGVLMTIAFISRLPQPFKFPEFVWRHIIGEPLTIDDIYSIDNEFQCFMKQMDSGEIDDIEAERQNLRFVVKNSHGETVELFQGGSGVNVTKERVSEYSQMCKKMRLKEMKRQLDWLRNGVRQFFPANAMVLLSPWELELIVCGDNAVPVSELKKHCKYNKHDVLSEWLWQVLEEFSPEERMLFIKFATGRMGLPPAGSRWHSDLSIVWVPSNIKNDADMPLPTAVTCLSAIRIPRYTTKEWMAKKIRAAIFFGADIDTDRQANFREIVPLT